MATKLLYLEDFDVVSCEATVVSVEKTEDGRTDVMLDQTCFYPRGGGQDWDTGTVGDNFQVGEVRLDEEGIVHHIGQGGAKPGETVACKVDEKRRTINTRLHSAGHIIDMAVSQLRPDWVAVKGAHYPHMSYVEYRVPDETVADEALIKEIQEKVNMLSNSDYQNKLLFVTTDEMSKYCRHVPENIPTNKPSRIVLYADDFGIPCGGTHVKEVLEVGGITITKIKIKKGVVKVSYAVQGIN